METQSRPFTDLLFTAVPTLQLAVQLEEEWPTKLKKISSLAFDRKRLPIPKDNANLKMII